MVLEGPIWCLIAFPTKVLNIHNSCTSAIAKNNGNHPYEAMAKFGYKLNMKHYFFIIL